MPELATIDREVNPKTRPAQLLHVHIPKTAGTSLRRVLIDSYGASNVMVYDPITEGVLPTSRRLTGFEGDGKNGIRTFIHSHGLHRLAYPLFLAAQAAEKAMSIDPERLQDRDFAVLSGHFTAENVQEWGLENVSAVTVVREPLERSWSHYQHMVRTGGKMRLPDTIPFSDDTSFEDFALHDTLQNYQTRILGNLSMHLVGVGTQLPAFIEELDLPRDEAEIPHKNIGNHSGVPELDPGFLYDFRMANVADYTLYNASVERWS